MGKRGLPHVPLPFAANMGHRAYLRDSPEHRTIAMRPPPPIPDAERTAPTAGRVPTGPATPALRILLLVAILACGWLVHSFLDALLIASIGAVLAWPLHTKLLRATRRPVVATVLTIGIVTVVVVGPATGLIWLVSREVVALARQLTSSLDTGNLDTFVGRVSGVPVVAWVVEQAGGAAALADSLRTAVQEGSASAGAAAGQLVPGIVGVTARVILKVVIFYLALASLVHRGVELSTWFTRVSPLPENHTRRLFQVFAELARNVVLAGLVTAAVQGAVAGAGFALAGVERPILFAVLTGVLSFVPLVGTAVAWVPVALLLLLQGRGGAALFVVIWSLALTGTVDNLIKPLIVRGRSHIPTLLVFLGVFGGLSSLGVIGAFVGPVLMAFMLTLLRFFDESLSVSGDAAGGPVRTA